VLAAGWRPLEGEGEWLAVAAPAAEAEDGTASALALEQLVAFAASRAG